MLDYRIILGAVATLIGLLSYIPYFRDIFRNRTKPHLFSWLIWAIITGVAFFAQLLNGGAAGSWVNASSALLCMGVFLLAFRYGEKDIRKLDVVCLLFGILAIVLWTITKNPAGAIILISIADVFAFAPTFRKAYSKPSEETIITYICSVIKYALSFVALTSFNFATAFFPIFAVILNGSFVVYVLARKRKIG